MEIAVLIKQVPDLVEDLVLADDGRSLAYDDLQYVPNEFDEHALEEALILKEETQARVTAVTVDTGDVDGALFAALAKGADRAVKLVGDFAPGLSGRARSLALAAYLKDQGFDLVLAGVQAVDDLDGQTPGQVAAALGVAHAAVVSEVRPADTAGRIRFRQEYSGGVTADFEAALPVVLGIQAARRPPRYVSVARVRQVARTASIEEAAADVPDAPTAPVRRLYRPEASGRAEMLGEDVSEVAERIVDLLIQRKLVRS